ncbi:MAG: hypothetical protein WBD45_23835, partial [Terriglobales bacterium]
MQFRPAFIVPCVFVSLLLGVQTHRAQAPTAPPTPPPTTVPGLPASAMRAMQTPPSVVAGIPVNYDEAKVGTYTLV